MSDRLSTSQRKRKQKPINEAATKFMELPVDERTTEAAGSILSDAAVCEFYSAKVKLVSEWVIMTVPPRISPGDRLKKGMPDLTPEERTAESRLYNTKGIATRILEYTRYKFFIDMGAMAETKTIFARDHQEAWRKVSEYIVEDMGGMVLSCFCYAMDDKKTNALSNLNGLFTPPDPEFGEYAGVKADNLLTDWRKEDRKSKE